MYLNITISNLNEIVIHNHSSELFNTDTKGYFDLHPDAIAINQSSFSFHADGHATEILQQEDALYLSCSCTAPNNKLCIHQAQILHNLNCRNELKIFFDVKLRHEKLKQFAEAYGLHHEADLDANFSIVYTQRKVVFKPKISGLLPITKESTQNLQQLLSLNRQDIVKDVSISETELVVVIRQHKYYKQVIIEIFKATSTVTGKLKNPLQTVNPLNLLWKADNDQEIKFYIAISRFQNNTGTEQSQADFDPLKAILKNPLKLRFYYHKPEISENVVASSLTEVKPGTLLNNISLLVSQEGDFYVLQAEITINQQKLDLQDVTLKFDYFVLFNNKLYLIGSFQLLKLIYFLKQHNFKVTIHNSKFKDFKDQVLAKIEDNITTSYNWIKPATTKQTASIAAHQVTEKFLYLTETDNYVELNPVMKYGDSDIPILTKRQIYSTDTRGNTFLVQRDNHAEIQFISLLTRQHPFFEEQFKDELLCFHLHKKKFLNEDWFIPVFEDWKNNGITVLGFNELKGNKLNSDKASITIKVLSGINWFNANVSVRFGRKKASLKQVQKAIKNKNKYVLLDDGTLGILPKEWMDKLAACFEAGELDGESIKTAKTNFLTLADLYETEYLDEKVKEELELYQRKLSDFSAIDEVKVPETLTATLRDYQKQGLNWLNFLDDFNFGGCLADDMGLGKSIQIIAFILLQRKKVLHNVNLLVVPTSLIFNWQTEFKKFAPSVKLLTVYGADRKRDTKQFLEYEVILTSYGTLLSDISHFKKYQFNYVFLDESQNIKNPESQRYAAVMQLQSRNKIVITGTPMENNTFDLYGQFSFACPGLLGTKQYFKDIYSIPIDRFKDDKRALMLRKKISPFLLRRTKNQVATELPDKTEIILYCKMGEEQQKVYDVHEKELRDFISASTNEEIPKRSMYVLKGLTKLRQICNSTALVPDTGLPLPFSAKIDTLMEQIEGKSAHHKILIYSSFVSMLNLIRKKLDDCTIQYSYLTGSTKNRETVINKFQNNTDVRVFLISLKAGGTGLNLTEADYVYLVDPWWNPAVESQAIDRIYRIGQKKNVMAIRLICPDTVEEKIITLQHTKRQSADQVIQTDTSLLKSLNKADLLSLFKHQTQ